MPRTSSVRLAALGLASLALVAPPHALARGSQLPADLGAELSWIREVASTRVAEQLGVKLAPSQPEEFVPGATIHGSVADPARLAAFGIAGAPVGARVTIMRPSTERVRVEVDELDPEPRTRRLALRIDAEGRLATATP